MAYEGELTGGGYHVIIVSYPALTIVGEREAVKMRKENNVALE
jgi:hypothetical protein